MSLLLRASRDEAAVSACADVWARSVARRDGAPAQIERATAGVRRRLGLPGASLLLATESDVLLGFALTAPTGSETELFHLAVDPDCWGRGVAHELLVRVQEDARRAGCGSVDLWVIDGNDRAANLYLRHGWLDTGEIQTDPHGPPERRLRKALR